MGSVRGCSVHGRFEALGADAEGDGDGVDGDEIAAGVHGRAKPQIQPAGDLRGGQAAGVASERWVAWVKRGHG